MKLWAKTVLEEKITRNTLYEYLSVDDIDGFVKLMQEVCEKLDVPTPVVTGINFEHFTKFNNTKFKPRDFVESVDFDFLELEAVPEKHKKNHI